MVKLNKIYTRTGDDGTTGLGTGQRVLKTDPRVTAYGEVDEANAALGLVVIAAVDDAHTPHAAEIADIVRGLQHDLFDVGADLCIPPTDDEQPNAALRINESQVHRLEALIDRANTHLAPLHSFVLPGGTHLASTLHLARTITRRAERATIALAESEPGRVGQAVIAYLNRLSDLLFVLARLANNEGRDDVLWVPGANRDEPDHQENRKD
ncbi:MAG: cob(I)yrinic acid a,c-diamide adenosyltransferase [Phycisphaeraceae bacterium]|nr:MAG: cob(I)yrinic acid a,c-diamide adenosyltransferase [Phycisphaeraceae bacterium]